MKFSLTGLEKGNLLIQVTTWAGLTIDLIFVFFFTPINCKYGIPAHGEVYLIQLYVVKFVCNLRQVSYFL
jgi:hypothetical protein